jgi:hypothetical protein
MEDSMKYIFGIGAFTLVAYVGWQLGGILSSDALGMALGCIFGLMAGIPMALIAMSAQKQRVDVYHHKVKQSPTQPTEQPTARITARPQRYIVVGQDAARLTVGQGKIEVTR